MVEINPKRITGSWTEGFALDFHTLSAANTSVMTNMDILYLMQNGVKGVNYYSSSNIEKINPSSTISSPL